MLETLGKDMTDIDFSFEGLNFITKNPFTDFGGGKEICAQVL